MNTADSRLIQSEKTLNLMLGGLGVALPTILYLGNLWVYGVEVLLPSISSYYYSNLGDVFVGVIFSMGLFLIAYEGYDGRDRLLSTIAGIFAIMVALIPTAPANTERDIWAIVHLVSAALFYLILMYFAIFRFTKSYPSGNTTRRKGVRNLIYRLSGIGILIALILLVVTETEIISIPLENSTFWLEFLANSAFGTAWLVKGEGIFFLNDDPIMQWNPWEVLGLFILLLLALGSVVMLITIGVLAY